MIETHGVDHFYVGHQGTFDVIVLSVLRELAQHYPIQYDVVLAYMPQDKVDYGTHMEQHTLLPWGIETALRRFAIDRRNRWMLHGNICPAFLERCSKVCKRSKTVGESRC